MLVAFIGIAGWALARLWTREFIAEQAKDKTYVFLQGKGYARLAYMIQCAFCFGSWATAAVWAITWATVGLPIPALSLGVAVGVMWLLTIIENALEKDDGQV